MKENPWDQSSGKFGSISQLKSSVVANQPCPPPPPPPPPPLPGLLVPVPAGTSTCVYLFLLRFVQTETPVLPACQRLQPSGPRPAA